MVTCPGSSSSRVRDAEQLHGPLDLAAEDLDGAVDALAAAGHQAVEVGAADQREAGAVRDRGDDVLAGHDPGVEVHLEVADRPPSRPRAAGGTAPAPGRAGGRRGWTARSRRRRASASRRASATVCTPLTDTLPGHCSRIQARSSKVTVGSNMVSSRSATVPDHESRRGEGQRLGGEEVEPPRRPRDGVGHGARRQRRRDRHAVAHVAQPGARDRDVDGDQQRVEAGLRRPVDQRHRAVAVLPHVELEPVAAARGRRRDVLDRAWCPSSTARTGCRRPPPRWRRRSRPRSASSG